MADMDKAIKLLSSSVGIKPATEGSSEIILEGGLVAAILQTAKGKKLMSRTIELLQPEKRWALIPVILARVLQSDPDNQSVEDKEVEQRLMRTVMVFIKQTQGHQEVLSTSPNPGAAEELASFSQKLLVNLRYCLRSVMVSQMEKTQLRKALLTSRARAEVMQNVVQVGDKVAIEVAKRSYSESTEWNQMREAFMSMLDG